MVFGGVSSPETRCGAYLCCGWSWRAPGTKQPGADWHARENKHFSPSFPATGSFCAYCPASGYLSVPLFFKKKVSSKKKTIVMQLKINQPKLCPTLLHSIHTPTLPTPTLLTFTCTQVLWFLPCLTRSRASSVTTRPATTTYRFFYPHNPVYERRLDPSVSVFSLSLYRQPFIHILFRSHFTS